MSETPPPPQQPGAPSEAEKQARSQRALAWITSHWPAPQLCPICGSQSWVINDLVEMRPYLGGSLHVGGPLFVMVPVMCRVCTYTLLFNAVASGVLERQAPAASLSGEGKLTAGGTVPPTPPSEGAEPGSPS